MNLNALLGRRVREQPYITKKSRKYTTRNTSLGQKKHTESQSVSSELSSEVRETACSFHPPDREEDTVAHYHTNEPQRQQVDVEVPGHQFLLIETLREAVIDLPLHQDSS